jgi:hypothetical protein
LAAVHAYAGVLVALTVPAQPRIDLEKFIARDTGFSIKQYPDDGEEHILRREEDLVEERERGFNLDVMRGALGRVWPPRRTLHPPKTR